MFYHGKDPYDGCTDLHNMLDLNKENKTFKRFISDYHVNLITANDLDETKFVDRDAGACGLLKAAGGQDKVNGVFSGKRGTDPEDGRGDF